MKEGQGKGVKRKNDDNDASLPTEDEMQERTNGQGERQQEEEMNDDVPMRDVAVASPAKVHDDNDMMEKLEQITEKILGEHSDPRFRTKWDGFDPLEREFLLENARWACNMFTSRRTFLDGLEGNFIFLFEDDKENLKIFVANFYTECKSEKLIVEGDTSGHRVASITHGLDQDFLGNFDLQELDKQIHKVLQWHEGDHKHYRSPSFAMVQSSGMGKTKLMQQYSHKCNHDDSSELECRLILCINKKQDEPPNFEKHYHAKLEVGGHERLTQNDRHDIRRQLDKIVRTCKKNKLLFFFDEAQELLPEISIGAYDIVVWWLRQTRTRACVGVFAGTPLGLCKIEVVKEPSSGFSRDAQQAYKNFSPWKKNIDDKLLLYDPYYTLTTISLPCSHNKHDDFVDDLKDIRKYGYNGRPLFAALLRRQGSASAPVLTLSDTNCHGGVVNNLTMHKILLRVLLSREKPNDWTSNDDSIASVLGTRVQLGLANYDFVNKAASSGYAMLVRYDAPKSDLPDQIKNFGSVAIVFPPDPVCAALAMGIMQPGWALRNGVEETSEIRGKEPVFWVESMARLFEQQFFLPDRGESSEVFAALYMLLCGDVLRYKQDPYMRLFEVDLEAWLVELEQKTPKDGKATMRPNLPKERETAPERIMVDEEAEQTNKDKVQGRMGSVDITGCHLTLNFIQVCRNYFQSHAWFGHSMLEYMYNTATGCYVFARCPAIDIVFPIKQVKKECGAISYHPCLVSVKTLDSMRYSGLENEVTRIREYVQDCRTNINDDKSTSALCLLIVLGSSSHLERTQIQGSFPNEDTYISIVVPSSDKFGVNETIKNMAGASQMSELLTSHSFAFAENTETALRVTATKAYCELGQRLLEDKQHSLANSSK